MNTIERWRAYQQAVDEFTYIHGPDANPWLVNPERAEVQCELFAAMPLWLRVALCLRGGSWRDAVGEVRR